MDGRTAGRFYVAVVQSVILGGSETWLVTPQLNKSLTGFYHQVFWRMAGMRPERQLDGTWVYTPIGAALATVGLDEIRVYIARLQNNVIQ